MKHDNQDLEFLKAKGKFIQNVLLRLRQWFILNPYPIEVGKIIPIFAAGAKRYGGINDIFAELEAEGLIEIKLIEKRTRIARTIMLTEFMRKGDSA